MRQPTQIEWLYLDFDGFFASVEQTVHPELRGKPVGVVPFPGTDRTCVIAASREAKLTGIGNAMPVQEARALCPNIILVPQSPDLYRRAHNALLSEISAVLPIDAVKSIDELTCRVEQSLRADPLALGRKLKARIVDGVGPYITCSVGFAANRQLAKMACKAGKRVGGTYGDGNTAWHPDEMPAPLLRLSLDDIPGVGKRMKQRLTVAGVNTMSDLLATQPKQLRALWGNVNGERLWYSLHGYQLQAPLSSRGMYGHGRVLPPEARGPTQARAASRLLIVKAARRMRREGWNAGRLTLWLALRGSEWTRDLRLAAVHDDQAVLRRLFTRSRREFALALIVIGGELTLGVLQGIALGVLLALLMLIYQTSHPQVAVLGQLPGTEAYRDIRVHPEALTFPGLLIWRTGGDLFFASGSHFGYALKDALTKNATRVERVLLDAESISFIDTSACDALLSLTEELKSQGITLAFEQQLMGADCLKLHFHGYIPWHGMLKPAPERRFNSNRSLESCATNSPITNEHKPRVVSFYHQLSGAGPHQPGK